MGIAFDGHGFSYPNAARFSNAADIVASEVHQHHVFSAFLRIRKQFPLQLDILFACRTPWSRASNRPHRDHPTFKSYQNFRRSSDNMEIAQVKVEHVWRWIERAQSPVQRQWR